MGRNPLIEGESMSLIFPILVKLLWLLEASSFCSFIEDLCSAQNIGWW